MCLAVYTVRSHYTTMTFPRACGFLYSGLAARQQRRKSSLVLPHLEIRRILRPQASDLARGCVVRAIRQRLSEALEPADDRTDSMRTESAPRSGQSRLPAAAEIFLLVESYEHPRCEQAQLAP